jgi:UDP-3-O-[3-hydroxymyristoyl] glucosamine N-acyltransferase
MSAYQTSGNAYQGAQAYQGISSGDTFGDPHDPRIGPTVLRTAAVRIGDGTVIAPARRIGGVTLVGPTRRIGPGSLN